MELRILGPIEVVSDGRQVRLGGPRQRALLAYLLLHANGAVPTERLLERLWDEPPTGGLAALQTQIYRLRRLLGDRIETSGHGYSIRVGPGELDLDVFRALLAEAGASADPAARSRLLREADALWRGEPLAGVDAPFARAEAAALDELRLSVLEDRLEADLERGCDGELVAELRVLVEEHPLRERLRGELILALYRSGRQAEALEAYRDTRRMLDDELGLEPSPALRELERAILRHDPALEPAVAAAAPARGRKRRAAWLVLAGAGLALAGVAGAAAVVLTDVAGSKRAAPGPTVRIVTVRTSEPSRRARTRVRPRVHHVHAAVRPAAPAAIVHVVTSAAATTTTTTATHAAPPATASTTTAPVKRTVSKPPPTPVTISDTFDGSQIDNTIWYQISEGSGWTLAQNDGQLEFAFPPDSQRGGQWDTFGGHIGTQCRFPGDFDARVDFTLSQWPAANGVMASLWGWFGPENTGWSSWRASSAQGGEQYGAYLGVGTVTGSPQVDDTTGTLRLARHAGVVTAYFLHDGGWVALGSAHMTETAKVAVGAGAWPPNVGNPFAGRQVVVDFDNFSVTAVDPDCPPGSEPPTP